MNNKLVKELMRKDLQEMMKNRYVLYSTLVMPAILLIIAIPSTVLTQSVAAGTPINISGIFSGMFIIIPAVIATFIGSTSIVIEKNNRSLEPLLGTPITDTELFVGKAMAPFLPAIVVALITYGIFIGVVDALTYNAVGHLLEPTYITLVDMLFISPITGLLGTFASMFVSSKMKDVRAAQQVSGLVILPAMLIIYLPLLIRSNDLLIIVIFGFALLAAAVLLAILTIKVFGRENILVNWT